MQMLTGLGIVGITYYFSDRFKLYTLNVILKEFFDNLFLIIVVLFQDDIRRALSRVGRTPFFSHSVQTLEYSTVVDEVIKATVSLAQRQIGALIVLARETGLKNYVEVGARIDSKVNAELIASIFMPSSPMHDGAVIIQNGRITAAGCFLPLSENATLDKVLGTRHRAAVGLTEETDAAVIIISEERSEISLALNGKLTRGLDSLTLRKILLGIFNITAVKDEKQLEAGKSGD